jgi:hypothetical protein
MDHREGEISMIKKPPLPDIIKAMDKVNKEASMRHGGMGKDMSTGYKKEPRKEMKRKD